MIAQTPPSANDKPDDQPTGPSNWQLIRRMLGLAWEYRRGCLRMLLLHTALLVVTLGALGLTGLGLAIIRHAARPASKPPDWPARLAPPAEWSPIQQVLLVGGVIFALALFNTALRYAATVAQARLVQDIIINLRARVYDKLQRLSFRFFDANESGSIINRVTVDVQSVRLFVDGVIIELMAIILSLAFFLSYMLSLHVSLTLVCMATTPLLWFATAAFSRTVRPAYRRNRQLVDRMVRTLSENLLGIRVVKGFGREEQQTDQFDHDNGEVRDQKRWIFQRVCAFVPSMQFLTMVNLVVLIGYGGYLAIHDPTFPIEQGLVVFAGLLQSFSTQVASVAMVADSIQRSLTGASRVFEVLDTAVEIDSAAGARRLDRALGDVRFEDVSFAYRSGEPVLERINLHVKPGQCVAIIGPTGSGKSTLLSLIPRFYDPTPAPGSGASNLGASHDGAGAGRVLIDGVDVRELDLDDLRRQIGIVFQQSFLFSNTVAANIAFGHPDADMQKIERAAQVAAAHEFIVNLPQGYDTVIGENGVDLSGGQRQRLAIARALLLDPPILLLDDATAAVDPGTEHEILQAMESAMAGRTTFVVAHRISTLRRADLVVVLEKGRIVQRGTHEQLMEMTGHYQSAAALQVGDEESKRLLGIT